ncbi:hypothetical protein HALLA_17355 [Halostagnicola larsenii XH-48]|uniref:Halobacterial output domain-containing protein n=1 Tax=Halostagnicola larsenii XH-48 TaxID=797299 RepID=W0JP00_9EURY|nr:HalOD1 output domain-containing protein [Halostagnicola larsenii]AHG00304.1 hypothetical protein HALLA_17355 [Halostagnicola larsenii XH-48]
MDLIRSNELTESHCIWDLIDAIAEVKEVEPSQLPPIYDTIDPEPIAALINDSGTDFELTFEYEDLQIRITPDRYQISADGEIATESDW